MLLINGVVALIGAAIAALIYWLQTIYIFEPYSLIMLCGLGFWALLSASDIVEYKLIALFNKDPR